MRFSDLERAIPNIIRNAGQQLAAWQDGIVVRRPTLRCREVEYCLTPWPILCPTLEPS